MSATQLALLTAGEVRGNLVTRRIGRDLRRVYLWTHAGKDVTATMRLLLRRRYMRRPWGDGGLHLVAVITPLGAERLATYRAKQARRA